MEGVRLTDVAKLAGVSKSTASRALSGSGHVASETRSRVARAAETLAFVPSMPASTLATGKSRTIALVTPFINRWFYGEVIDGVESSLIHAGYDLNLYRLTKDLDQRKALFDYFLARQRVDAVLALTLFVTDDEVRMLHQLGKPIIGIGGDIPSISSFSIDDTKSARKATEHLLELGHTKVIHIGGDQHTQLDFEVHSKRLAGFRQALDNAGLNRSNDFFADDFDTSGGYRSAMKALSDPAHRPTAVFAGCDEIAIGVLVAARELGIRVPEELSIIGMDGHPLSKTFGITTMDQSASSQGKIAVAEVLAQVGRKGVQFDGSHRELQVDLKIRSTTTNAP